MEHLGYLGDPINDLWYSNEELAGAQHKAVAYCTVPTEVPYRGYTLKEITPGAASETPARGMLATCQ